MQGHPRAYASVLVVSVSLFIIAGTTMTAAKSTVVQELDGQRCEFNLVDKGAARADIRIPASFAVQPYVVAQPGSPVSIIAVDLTSVSGPVHQGDRWVGPGGPVRVQIANLSDKVLRYVVVSLKYQTSRFVGGGLTLSSTGELNPGETTWMRGNGGGSSPPERIWQIPIAVEWVQFGDCVYMPAQLLPVSRIPPQPRVPILFDRSVPRHNP